MLQVQNTCLPTIRKLRNIRNIAQLQEKVYLGMLKYEDTFNSCVAQSRSPSDTEFCTNQLIKNLTVDFKPRLTKILEEY